MMNKLCLVIILGACLTVVAPTAANFLLNNGFEDGEIGQISIVGLPGWEHWGSDSWHHSDSERTIEEKAIALFWVLSGVGQTFDANDVEGSGKYAVGVEFLSSTTTDTYNGKPANMWGKDDIVSIQWYSEYYGYNNSSNVQIITGSETIDTDYDDVPDAVEVDRFEGGETIDEPEELEDVWVLKGDVVQAPPGAVMGRLIITQHLRPGHNASSHGGGAHIDETFVVPAEQARVPNPRDGAIASLATNELSWVQPEPADPADTVICSVYFACLSDSEPNRLIAEGDINSVTLSEVGITLEGGKEYHWAVDCYDTGTGITTEGPRWWEFTAGNGPPEVSVEDSYIWLTMDDGDSDPNSVVFQLTADVTDDGQPSDTLNYKWEMTEADSSVPTIQWMDPNTIEAPRVKFSATGSWRFELTVDDTVLTGSDEGQVIVYDSACEAAKGDPADVMLTSDINQDCQANIEDLLAILDSWLECMSDKLVGIKPECMP
jgi:hypothetical protein